MINICYSKPQGVILYRYSGRVDGIGSYGGSDASGGLWASTHMLRLCRMVFEGKICPVFLKGFHIFHTDCAWSGIAVGFWHTAAKIRGEGHA